jgi:hypothetical protein
MHRPPPYRSLHISQVADEWQKVWPVRTPAAERSFPARRN